MNAIKSLAFEAVFIGLAAAGWVWDIAAARWALYVLVWQLLLPGALLYACNPRLQAVCAEELPPRSDAARLCSLLAWLVAMLVLLAHGAWLTAGALTLCLLCMSVYHDAVARLRDRDDARSTA
ncbi:MAG TPA: hypothetical protein PKE15_00060 [Ottowia sp.]|nr:hypothetical protein [Ottowia sp.]